MLDISPSLLACDYTNLGKQIELINNSKSKSIHLDVMDGIFVNNISYGMPLISSLRKITDLKLDTHLMIKEPIRYISNFAEIGCDSITFHYEATSNPENVIYEIKKYKKKVGIAINPNTSVDVIKNYIDEIDMILIMTVYPGFGGQKFINDQLNKIDKIYSYLKTINHSIDIQVDGGINKDTIALCANKGANIFVCGSSIFNSNNITEQISDFFDVALTNYRGNHE